MIDISDPTHIYKVILDESICFEDKALSLYRYQMAFNPTYRSFVSYVRNNEYKPEVVRDIPFFPISLFKSSLIKAGDWPHQEIFMSSGTTQSIRSRHAIRDIDWYLSNARYIWQEQFGSLDQFTFLSLLPNYHDNPSSSLLCMVRDFMVHGAGKEERYYIDGHEALHEELDRLDGQGKTIALFGVSFALLDYVDQFGHTFVNKHLVIETGGMKKFRKEITREDLHAQLKLSFNGATILSEYGMTECMSQMYTAGGKSFLQNKRMRAFISDATDPLTLLPEGQRGRICLIDLANVDTMPFIATDDLGVITSDGLEILGRLDASDLRGCNYLIN